MKKCATFLLVILVGCANDRYMNDTPAIGPQRPVSNVKVEMVEGDMVCVTENNDTANRTCVPVVHAVEGGS